MLKFYVKSKCRPCIHFLTQVVQSVVKLMRDVKIQTCLNLKLIMGIFFFVFCHSNSFNVSKLCCMLINHEHGIESVLLTTSMKGWNSGTNMHRQIVILQLVKQRLASSCLIGTFSDISLFSCWVLSSMIISYLIYKVVGHQTILKNVKFILYFQLR